MGAFMSGGEFVSAPPNPLATFTDPGLGDGDVPHRRAEAVTPPDVARHPTYPRGVSKGLLGYAPIILAAAIAALLYEQTAIEFIHQPSFQFVYLVVFPTLAVAVGFITHRLSGRNLFRACLAGVSCALVLEMFSALVVGLSGAV